MTLDTLFLLVILLYLVLIAYGLVGARRRGLPRGARIATGALMVLIPPAALLAAIASAHEPALTDRWTWAVLAMPIAGAAVAMLVGWLAPRLGA